MNKEEILQIASKHYSEASAIVTSGRIFEIVSIKAFRATVKKLRAFFILLEMERRGTVQFTLSNKIRQLYVNLGYIAKLHFHLKNIKRLCQNTSSAIPVLYLKKIQQNIDYWNDRTKELLRAQNNFDDDEKLIISFLPDQLRSVSIKKFLEYSSFELQRLQRLNDDESLQSIKKLLEDISYNWPIVRLRSNLLPKKISKLKHINEWIKILADLHKNNIDVALLRVNNTDIPGEKEILKNLEQQLVIQNHSLRQNIYNNLNQEKFDTALDKTPKARIDNTLLNRPT